MQQPTPNEKLQNTSNNNKIISQIPSVNIDQQSHHTHSENISPPSNHFLVEPIISQSIKLDVISKQKQLQIQQQTTLKSMNTKTFRLAKTKQILTQRTIKNLIGYFNQQRQYSLAYIASRQGLSIRKVSQARNQYYESKKIKTTEEWRNQIQQDQKYVSGRVSRRFRHAARLIGQILQKNPTISAQTIRRQLTNRKVLVKSRSFYYLLHQQGYVYRRLQQATFSKNTPQIIQKRFQYTEELKQFNLDQLIYISQTTFNASNFINHGWVRKSQLNRLKVPENPNNIQVLAVANIQHILAYYLKRGPIQPGQVFNLIIDKVLPLLKDTDILIIGPLKNASATQIKNYFSDQNLTVKDLPPFSPQLNPLESFFSVIKSSYRRIRLDKRLKDPKLIQKTVISLIQEEKNSDLQANFKKMRDHFRLAQKKADFQPYI